MSRRKTADAKLLALKEDERKAREGFERWFRKAKRGWTELEKARLLIQRLQRRIRAREDELAGVEKQPVSRPPCRPVKG